MNQQQALDAFMALSQETRLEIVRALVKEGPDGLAAGAIAEAMKVSPSNVSFHLSHLERAGLIQGRREARSIVYSASYETLGALIRFLTEDCCQGRPEICAPLAEMACLCDAETTT
jgi:ArsR family transcriptional regulator, arsenate/arsenite/antimonite-responsive transcriptional repressor